MAFSTQKGFLPVTYMNERNTTTCSYVEVPTLKTYASTSDQRAWAHSKDLQSRYLLDLVECRMYTSNDGGDDFQSRKPCQSLKSIKSKDNQSISKCIGSSDNRTPKKGNSSIAERSFLGSFVKSKKGLLDCSTFFAPDADAEVIPGAETIESIVQSKKSKLISTSFAPDSEIMPDAETTETIIKIENL